MKFLITTLNFLKLFNILRNNLDSTINLDFLIIILKCTSSLNANLQNQ
jgi:hypothetical protein